LLFGGGIIPEKDIAELKSQGVGELFTPGAPTQSIVGYIKEWVGKRKE
jgi:methylmalonyl-CoA mutase C-terminal domain/subunit